MNQSHWNYSAVNFEYVCISRVWETSPITFSFQDSFDCTVITAIAAVSYCTVVCLIINVLYLYREH